MGVVVDSEPLVALLIHSDAHHRWTLEQAANLMPPLYTCEPVINDVHFLLSSVPLGANRFNQLPNSDRIGISFRYAQHSVRIAELMCA